MSQQQQILRHLQKRPITPLEALNRYGVFRLAARIADLRASGHPIVTDRVERDGKTFARYRMAR